MKPKLVALHEIAQIFPGRHIEAANHNTNRLGVPYITGPSDFGELQATPSRWTQRPDAMCAPGDVLVVVKGAGVGNANLAPNDPACIGRQIMAIRANPGQTDPLYLLLALTAARDFLKSEAIGATVPGLSIENLETLRIPDLPLGEQSAIAKSLDKRLKAVRQAQTAAKSQLQELNLLPQKLLAQVFDA